MFGSAPYSGRSSSIKPSCSKTDLNRCVQTKTKMLEHPRSSPSVACPTRSELKSIPVDWAVGLCRNRDIVSPCDQSPAYSWPSCYRCCQRGCSACLARRSFQVGAGSRTRHSHIPYESQLIWALSVRMTKARWFRWVLTESTRFHSQPERYNIPWPDISGGRTEPSFLWGH